MGFVSRFDSMLSMYGATNVRTTVPAPLQNIKTLVGTVLQYDGVLFRIEPEGKHILIHLLGKK